ncbi:protein NLP2 isoform X2 [Diospyros lotus]|uniref:protein NLP2 isoform X2 n=1 Tax=Diospyros lotus TaxID=55363 RepID=UPI002256C04F|nr:protein NLP2 isoform X2 [Diospyros lotus]
MEDGAFTPKAILETFSDKTMDLDIVNELLYDGYWLETTEGSNFWQPDLSTSSDLNFSLNCFSTYQSNMDQFTPNAHLKIHQEGTERSNFADNPHVTYPQKDDLVGSQIPNREAILPRPSLVQSEDFLVENTETNKRLWILPNAKAGPASSVKKRLMQAIEYLREFTRDGDALIQIWVPIKRAGRHFLTTNNQPFSLSSNCKSLADYRDVSRSYKFAAEANSKDFMGLPGRVFMKKLPEWTPDVRFFRKEEYPRVSYAQQYNVSGSLALPVFERGSGTCLGVVEIVTTAQTVKYIPELENVRKALEGCDDSYQGVVIEIKEVFKYVCDTYRLPLAQTWVPCTQQGRAGCRHSNENYIHCVSTVDSACYVLNPDVLGFHEACSEHHLLRGEGVVGGAFMTNQPCFASDIRGFSKSEYPLSHHAMVFKLRAAVAIRFRSIYTGSADFVLEFFLPPDCQDAEEQTHMLRSLSSVIQEVCRSLRVVTNQELAEEATQLEKVTAAPSLGRFDGHSQNSGCALSKGTSHEDSSWLDNRTEAQRKGKSIAISLGYQKEPEEGFEETTDWDNDRSELHHVFSKHTHIHQDSGPRGSAESGGGFSSVSGLCPSSDRKPGERRRTKTEKTIGLEVLRQYFAGSLKDAAKSIGVCPTTLKRICRQHGITRWPSRKIKKVGHSLRKLQLVIDSVQGVQGGIQLTSFYSNFPELSSPTLPPEAASPVITSKMNDQLKHFDAQPEGSLLSPVTTTSKSPSSSCSLSSSSSFCCSTEARPQPAASFVHGPSGGDISLKEPQGGGQLKRARSDLQLHDSGQEETKNLVRSQSHQIFSELPSPEAVPPLPRVGSPRQQVVRDGSAFKVKATFGEEKVRLSIQQNCRFQDLRQEIVKRFNINSKIDLKYLDDDSEWVLLRCDEDVEECIDIHRSSNNSRTIKLLVHQASVNPNLGSSFGT